MLSYRLLIAVILITVLNSVAFANNELESKIKKIVSAQKENMDIGVGYLHVESGKSFYINKDKPYPLASVFKVPVMVCTLKKVDAGELSLKDKIKMYEYDKCIGGGNLQYSPSGTEFPVSTLIREMITVSDNTATDLLWKSIGDSACNRLMTGLKLKNSDIYTPNRPSYLLSLAQGTEFKGKSGKKIAEIWKKKTPQEKTTSIKNVLAETKKLTLSDFQKIEALSESSSTYKDDVLSAEALDNLSSPHDFTQLLLKLYNGELLSKSSSQFALNTMAGCKFNNRIPARLPKNVKVMHKTGTICGVVNDAGIIEVSPDNHIIVTVFVRDIKSGFSGKAADTIAEISKQIYNYSK